jgi:hypothetical protein
MHDIYSFATGALINHPGLAILFTLIVMFPSIDFSTKSGVRLRIRKK